MNKHRQFMTVSKATYMYIYGNYMHAYIFARVYASAVIPLPPSGDSLVAGGVCSGSGLFVQICA